ncbi:glycosyltransferase family 2 protein [Shewanella sp. WPAGA9]|uniref:glycosyltransferase family 2 protein n=1 Tax=Shewanella sp. ENK2 TaxID=2775245 RepID=UPI0017868F39|nr:glycosyltransferase family A protein [Shewanella sp. WPAGA9]
MFLETSIITPMYNCKEFISQTIQSVIKQSYVNWELILIDDCSTDGTFEEVSNAYKDHPQITIIKNQVNSGAGYTRNHGLQLAKGRFIAFLDSDDIWCPDKLEKQLTFMKINNAPISHTSFSFINESGAKRSGLVEVSEKVNLETLMRKTEIGTSTAIVDTSVTGKFSFELIRTRQDIRLWMELMSLGHISYGLDEVLVNYRVRSNQISSNKFIMLYQTFRVYTSFTKISMASRIIYFFSYVLNSIFKRMKSN